MATLIERTTTEEYDEDKTSRTVVEKYAPTDKERAIMVLENEAECVRRQSGNGCGRKCEHCDLVLADSEVLAAYDAAIKALSERTMPNEARSMLGLYLYVSSLADGLLAEAQNNSGYEWKMGLAIGYSDCARIIKKHYDALNVKNLKEESKDA